MLKNGYVIKLCRQKATAIAQHIHHLYFSYRTAKISMHIYMVGHKKAQVLF